MYVFVVVTATACWNYVCLCGVLCKFMNECCGVRIVVYLSLWLCSLTWSSDKNESESLLHMHTYTHARMHTHTYTYAWTRMETPAHSVHPQPRRPRLFCLFSLRQRRVPGAGSGGVLRHGKFMLTALTLTHAT